MPLINVNGAELYYEEFGTGDEVVISSAMGFNPAYPASLADPPTGYRVLTLQARGFGKSVRLQEPPAEGWLGQWADDVCAFADALGIERFVYTGISHGGGIGWTIAVRQPGRLKALVSVVGTPHLRYGTTDSSESRRQVVENRGNAAVIREQMAFIAGRPDPDREQLREKMLDQAVQTHLARDEDEARINQGMPFPEAKTNEELAEILRSIELPVLILGGMRDGVIPAESALLAGSAVRGAKTVLFENEGHFLARERPERLIREIRVFIDELNGTAEPAAREAVDRVAVEAGTV